MRICGLLVVLCAVAAIGCAPEWKDGSYDGGWKTYAVGLCEAESEGKTGSGLSCVEADKCLSFCCQCANGTKYTVAACSAEAGCLPFGEACKTAEAEVCK